MIPLNEAPKSWLYSIEGRDCTAMKTLSRSPVSQLVIGAVEVKRTGKSATLTAGGAVPPAIHDLADTASGPMERVASFWAGLGFPALEFAGLESAGFEFAAFESALVEEPPGKDCPGGLFPVPGVFPLLSFEVLPARPASRPAY